MARNQLDTLYRFECDKEQAIAQELQQAEYEFQQHQGRLQSVSAYRLEYMKRLSDRSMKGVDSSTYSHFHAFISKLDYANEQVKVAMNQAKALVKQKKEAWFKQKQKVQAVELLKEKAQRKAKLKANKQEQRMFDEIATQQFIRRQQG